MNNFYKNKNILVTGGAGFIGSHLIEELVKYGASVKVLDNLSTGNLENLSSIINKIEFINGSITDFNSCLKAAENIDTIFHLAAYTSVPGSVQEPLKCHEINIDGTVNLLESARVNKVKNFVFSSSSAVYGNKNIACKEDLSCEPSSIYGLSKLIGELYCKQYFSLYNINTVILRYFNVHGPRQINSGPLAPVYSKFKELIKNNKPINIFGDGSQKRDFVPVDKVIQANLNAAFKADKVAGQIFNVASGKSISIKELIEILKQEFPNYNQEVKFEPARQGDIQHSLADCSKLKELFL